MQPSPKSAESKSIFWRVSITPIQDPHQASSALASETEQSVQCIQHRAFEHFQRRGAEIGHDLDDWLRAEEELLWRPRAEMFENPFAVVLRVAAPGFDAKSILITAAPHAILVQASEIHRHYGLESRLRFCEFGERLFRRFDLPAKIDPQKVSATLDKGILQIVAEIARPRGKPPSGG